MPAAEVEVDAEVVACLLSAQWPGWLGQDVTELAHGWDNVLFRVGEHQVARLPRRSLAVALLENEVRWLPHLAPRLPLPIPAPVFVGSPGCGYPWPWSLVNWIPGTPAGENPSLDPAICARTLGRFLRALHRPAPPEAPSNPFRGVPLADREEVTRLRTAQMSGEIEEAVILRVFDAALALPRHTTPFWLHGDLHPQNLLVENGRLSGVIDFGDLAAGDPATDLAVAWMMFRPAERLIFRSAYGIADDDAWGRARGWAVSLGLAYIANSADNPIMYRIGARTLAEAQRGG